MKWRRETAERSSPLRPRLATGSTPYAAHRHDGLAASPRGDGSASDPDATAIGAMGAARSASGHRSASASHARCRAVQVGQEREDLLRRQEHHRASITAYEAAGGWRRAADPDRRQLLAAADTGDDTGRQRDAQRRREPVIALRAGCSGEAAAVQAQLLPPGQVIERHSRSRASIWPMKSVRERRAGGMPARRPGWSSPMSAKVRQPALLASGNSRCHTGGALPANWSSCGSARPGRPRWRTGGHAALRGAAGSPLGPGAPTPSRPAPARRAARHLHLGSGLGIEAGLRCRAPSVADSATGKWSSGGRGARPRQGTPPGTRHELLLAPAGRCTAARPTTDGTAPVPPAGQRLVDRRSRETETRAARPDPARLAPRTRSTSIAGSAHGDDWPSVEHVDPRCRRGGEQVQRGRACVVGRGGR